MAITQADLDLAKSNMINAQLYHGYAVNAYDSALGNVAPCYDGTKLTSVIYQTTTGNVYDKDKCVGGVIPSLPVNQGCNQPDKDACQNFCGQINDTYGPNLRNTYIDVNTKTAYYNDLLAQFQLEATGAATAASADILESEAFFEKYKNVIYVAIGLFVIGMLIFIYLVFIRKKKIN